MPSGRLATLHGALDNRAKRLERQGVTTPIPPETSSAPASSEPAVDVSALGAQLANPRRPRLAEARAAAEGASSGAEAWQRMVERGLVPEELARSPHRLFAVANTERSAATATGDRLELHPAPPTVEAAVTLAADAANALEAERLARTLRERLVPWGAKTAERIEWVLLTHRIPFSFRQGSALNIAMYSLELALEQAGVELRRLRPEIPEVPSFVNYIVRANEGWPRAVARSVAVLGEYKPPAELVGRRFAALENPFEIALRIWSLGYVLDHSSAEETSSARLDSFVIDAPLNLLDQIREQRRRGEG